MTDATRKPDPGEERGAARERAAAGVREEERVAREMPRWYKLAAIVLSVLVLLVGSVGYTTYVDGKRALAEREHDRRWCELLIQLDQAYSETPPATELGRSVATHIHNLRVSLEC